MVGLTRALPFRAAVRPLQPREPSGLARQHARGEEHQGFRLRRLDGRLERSQGSCTPFGGDEADPEVVEAREPLHLGRDGAEGLNRGRDDDGNAAGLRIEGEQTA